MESEVYDVGCLIFRADFPTLDLGVEVVDYVSRTVLGNNRWMSELRVFWKYFVVLCSMTGTKFAIGWFRTCSCCGTYPAEAALKQFQCRDVDEELYCELVYKMVRDGAIFDGESGVCLVIRNKEMTNFFIKRWGWQKFIKLVVDEFDEYEWVLDEIVESGVSGKEVMNEIGEFELGSWCRDLTTAGFLETIDCIKKKVSG